MSDIDLDLVRQVVDILNESCVREISIRKGDLTISARRGDLPLRNAAQPAAPQPPPSAEPASDAVTATANWVGLFHRTEKGAKDPLVDVGSTVEAGQTLGYIESVKLWNEVASPCAGVVRAVMAAEGQPVEYGEALFVLAPE